MMTRSVVTQLLMVSLMLSLSACAGGGSPGGGGDAGLTGRTFLSTEVTGRTVVPGTRIELEFPEEGKLTARAGCNHLLGDVAVDGDRLKVSGMAGTDMGCERSLMDQDQWLTAFMLAGPKFALTGDDLVLTGDKEVIKLVDRETAVPDQAITGTRWVVESLVQGQAVSSVPQGAEAFLVFEGDRVTGSTGCNSLSGKAIHSSGKVVISDVASTKKACTEALNRLESEMLEAITGESTVKIDGDRLELTNTGNGKGLQLRSAAEPRPTTS